MHQILFKIPLIDLPIHGFGVMLFLAFIICTWLAGRRAEKEGIAKTYVQDLAIWLFVSGIIGARIFYVIFELDAKARSKMSLLDYLAIWEGGIVFYGSAFGAVICYVLMYYFVYRKHGWPAWKMLDIIAPSVAMGLCLGRIGCFLNGCCFGNVACEHCPQVHFPLPAAARYVYVDVGYQTAAGFTLPNDGMARTAAVAEVEPASPAADSDLRPGDVIVGVTLGPAEAALLKTIGDLQKREVIVEADCRTIRIRSSDELAFLFRNWPRGKSDLSLTVLRAGEKEPINLPPFVPRTIGLHPTQLYESISTFLIFLLLTAFYPFRRRYGEVMVLLMFSYAVHRFLDEILRNDTDPVAFGMTLSQNVSILLFAAAVGVLLWLRYQPRLEAGGRRPEAGGAENRGWRIENRT